MPYASLAALPAHVKKLSAKKQRQWRAIFNSTFEKTKSEEKAFKAANAILKEGVDMKKNGHREIDFTSDIAEAVGTAIIKRDEGVIEGVVLLTGEKVSRNKTFYTKKAISEAVNRYEGAKMYLDHPKPDEGNVRSVRDLGGHYKNLRVEEGQRLKADLHLLNNSAIRDLVIPIAESKPTGVGLSIRDRGKGRDEKGVFLVEGFAPKGTFSIDLVTEASVNETLFESTEGGSDMKIEEVTLKDLQDGNPALVESIKTETRQTVMKELEEKLKKGDEADKVILESQKARLLLEAGFAKEVSEKIKKLIDPENVTREMAESIITTHKEILAEKKPAPDPKVKGHGGTKEGGVTEGELPSDEALTESLVNA